MSFPESPIDTKPYMGAGGEFDYKAAWREVRPRWDTLPSNLRDLFLRVRVLAADIRQDSKLDLPWPRREEMRSDWDPFRGDLRTQFAKTPAEELQRAASVIHALGHWLPGDASDEDRALFAGDPADGCYWKFALYADQSLRARAGKPSRGREPRKPTELETRCRDLGVKVQANPGAPDVDFEKDDWRATATGWTVKLTYEKKSLTVPFWQGAAHERPPTAADVLSCLLSDANGIEGAESFEAWASDLGFDTDSRKAKRTYQQCQKIATRVRLLLGEDFDLFATAEH